MKYGFVLVCFLAFSAFGGIHNPITGLKSYTFPTQRFTDREDGKESFWKRISFGGNIGLQIGNPTNIILSPAIGYIPKGKLFNDKFMIGVGVTYMYQKVKYYGINYEANIYGGRTFARYIVFQISSLTLSMSF